MVIPEVRIFFGLDDPHQVQVQNHLYQSQDAQSAEKSFPIILVGEDGEELDGSVVDVQFLLTYNDDSRIGIPIYYGYCNTTEATQKVSYSRWYANAPLIGGEVSLSDNGFEFVREFREDVSLTAKNCSSLYYSTYRINKSSYPIPAGRYQIRLELFTDEALVAVANVWLKLLPNLPVREHDGRIFDPEDYLSRPPVKIQSVE